MTNTNNPYGQSNGQSGQSNNQSNSFRSPDRFGNRYAMNRNQADGISQNTRQKIRRALAQNGFRNIQVIPEAFIIRAQAPDGSHVVMQVSPDQFAEVVSRTNGYGSSGNGNQGMNQSGPEQNGQSGTQGSGASSMGSGVNNNWGNNNKTGH